MPSQPSRFALFAEILPAIRFVWQARQRLWLPGGILLLTELPLFLYQAQASQGSGRNLPWLTVLLLLTLINMLINIAVMRLYHDEPAQAWRLHRLDQTTRGAFWVMCKQVVAIMLASMLLIIPLVALGQLAKKMGVPAPAEEIVLTVLLGLLPSMLNARLLLALPARLDQRSQPFGVAWRLSRGQLLPLTLFGLGFSLLDKLPTLSHPVLTRWVPANGSCYYLLVLALCVLLAWLEMIKVILQIRCYNRLARPAP
ncbi:hypothetical protein THUN1379_10970 [Paludibacterium sp. THUN1379]|uniref:hypothetical protein n=1 Tax=Paludibacterium sp. THUN1379 TaxID=3112107 RepID=UPI003092D372|nr:hypothetical protein THUN1379_10970 [Paludibacterium sp. THUN1379]